MHALWSHRPQQCPPFSRRSRCLPRVLQPAQFQVRMCEKASFSMPGFISRCKTELNIRIANFLPPDYLSIPKACNCSGKHENHVRVRRMHTRTRRASHGQRMFEFEELEKQLQETPLPIDQPATRPAKRVTPPQTVQEFQITPFEIRMDKGIC